MTTVYLLASAAVVHFCSQLFFIFALMPMVLLLCRKDLRSVDDDEAARYALAKDYAAQTVALAGRLSWGVTAWYCIFVFFHNPA